MPTSSRSVHVDYLCNHPKHADAVADWIFSEWGDGSVDGSERAKVRVRERMRQDAAPLTLVALDGDEPVGTVSLFQCDMAGWEHLSPWLAALYVTPSQRETGVASHLIAAAEAEAARLGFDRLYLQAQRAAGMYAAAGWRTVISLPTERGETSVMERDLRELPIILYRADGDSHVGLGHVAHAIRLDRVVREAGLAEVRLLGHFDSSVTRMVGESGMLAPIPLVPDSDYTELMATVVDVGARMVAFNLAKESLESSGGLFARLSDDGVLQVHFDNPFASSACADLVVNSLPHIDWGYDDSTATNLCEGLEYFLLDPLFADTEPTVRTAEATRVLISMGGGDAPNLTGLILQALQEAGYSGTAEVVVGAANPHGSTVRQQAREVAFGVVVHDHLPSLASVAAECDLAFSALGLTTYEFAAIGLPTVILAGSELNAQVADIYSRSGAARSLGYYRDWTLQNLATAIADVLGDSKTRAEMSARGPELVDGEGARRVCELIAGLLEENQRDR